MSVRGRVAYGQVPQTESWQVVTVQDGDTLTVQSDSGKQAQVRLCGIDAPALTQPLGEQSRDNLKRLVDGAKGKVMVMVTDRDRSGAIVGEVFIAAPTPQQPEQESLLNGEQVVSGFASVYAKYVGQCPNGGSLVASEAQAKRQRLGVWRR